MLRKNISPRRTQRKWNAATAENTEKRYLKSWPTDGCIPICFEGCSFWTFIVTAGDLVGSIWSHCADWYDEDDPTLEGWNLAPQPPGIRLDRILRCQPALSPAPTFLEWYGAWLYQSITDYVELPLENKKLASRHIKKVANVPTPLPTKDVKYKSLREKILDILEKKK